MNRVKRKDADETLARFRDAMQDHTLAFDFQTHGVSGPVRLKNSKGIVGYFGTNYQSLTQLNTMMSAALHCLEAAKTKFPTPHPKPGKKWWKEHIDKDTNRVKAIFTIETGQLACISNDGTYEGLNEYMEEYFGGDAYKLQDINYKCLAVDTEKDLLYIEADADASDLFNDEY